MFYTVSSQTDKHTHTKGWLNHVLYSLFTDTDRHTKQYQHTSWINDILVVLARLKVGQGGVAGCRKGHHLQKSNSSSTFYHSLTGFPLPLACLMFGHMLAGTIKGLVTWWAPKKWHSHRQML